MNIKEDINYIRRYDLEISKDVETLCIELLFANSPNILLCTTYRRPWMQDFDRVESSMSGNQVIVLGDFYVDYLYLI